MRILKLFAISANRTQKESHLNARQTRSNTSTHTLRGDTLIEVSFAITIFAIVSVLAVGLMNSSMQTAETNLEVTMARSEIDAQANALRFIQNSYIADRSLVRSQQAYRNLWLYLTTGDSSINGLSYSPTDPELDSFNNLAEFNSTDDLCAKSFYTPNGTKYSKAFIINTRALDPQHPESTVQKNSPDFRAATMYPRLLYDSADLDESIYEAVADTNLSGVEGIWVLSVRDRNTNDNDAAEYYDFHIRTCWYAPGRQYPTTIATVIRLYNPEFIEGDFQ